MMTFVAGSMPASIEPTPSDCAYAAGFIDGEGTIFIAVNNNGKIGCVGPTYNMRVMAAQDDPAPLIWLRDRWGGSVRGKKARPNGKIGLSWYCFSRMALKFLRDVRPHLILKARHADIAIAFQETVRWSADGKAHPPEYRERLEGYRRQIMDLHAMTGREWQ